MFNSFRVVSTLPVGKAARGNAYQVLLQEGQPVSYSGCPGSRGPKLHILNPFSGFVPGSIKSVSWPDCSISKNVIL